MAADLILIDDLEPTPNDTPPPDAPDYDSMRVPQLRAACIDQCKATGQPRSWIQLAQKEDLVQFLKSGTAPTIQTPQETAQDTPGAHEDSKPAPDIDKPAPMPGMDDTVLEMLARALRPRLDIPDRLDLDPETMRETIHAELETGFEKVIEEVQSKLDAIQRPRELVITAPPALEPISVGLAHAHLETLLRVISADLPCLMVGPLGSGKSHAGCQVADALHLQFYCRSVCDLTSEVALLGYMDAQGNYVRTLFREAYEHGGVFLLDEIDAGNPAMLLVLNSSLANHHCAFPDAMIERHADFRLIAAANTYLTGADRQYVGRNQIDAATVNRFFFLDWPYDESLEAAIIGATA